MSQQKYIVWNMSPCVAMYALLPCVSYNIKKYYVKKLKKSEHRNKYLQSVQLSIIISKI